AAGIDVQFVGNVTIAGNFLGTDPTGTLALGNTTGVAISGGSQVDVGGASQADRNVSSGNVFGVGFNGDGGGNLNKRVLNKCVGTEGSGFAALGNDNADVEILGGSGNVIGVPGVGNVISASKITGLDVASSNSTVQGNLIGTDATGTKKLGNGIFGVSVFQ